MCLENTRKGEEFFIAVYQSVGYFFKNIFCMSRERVLEDYVLFSFKILLVFLGGFRRLCFL